mmetsp:Transcript_15735/g.34537  ORF Transcript_15735/g.34537 Transcript_15735/m.34537 type:complete len:249 (-) Transcript_15735:462-1208(-)
MQNTSQNSNESEEIAHACLVEHGAAEVAGVVSQVQHFEVGVFVVVEIDLEVADWHFLLHLELETLPLVFRLHPDRVEESFLGVQLEGAEIVRGVIAHQHAAVFAIFELVLFMDYDFFVLLFFLQIVQIGVWAYFAEYQAHLVPDFEHEATLGAEHGVQLLTTVFVGLLLLGYLHDIKEFLVRNVKIVLCCGRGRGWRRGCTLVTIAVVFLIRIICTFLLLLDEHCQSELGCKVEVHDIFEPGVFVYVE